MTPYSFYSLDSLITSAQNDWRLSGSSYVSVSPAVEGEVQKILDRLVAVSPLRGYPVRARLVADGEINAQTDGKTIYLSSGLWIAARHDVSLIAGILAHELGHIVAHHAAQRSRSPNLFIQIASPLLGTTKVGALGALIVREGIQMREKSYNRRNEIEADAIAAMLAHHAGYDPHGLIRFFDPSSAKTGFSLVAQIPPANYAESSAAFQGAALFLLRASPLYKSAPRPRNAPISVNG